MMWEFIATFTAGVGAAGIALMLRRLSNKKAPKWLIPVFAALGMLGFQIQSEYGWYSHQISLLPEGVKVVREVQEQSWYRPWSYVWPQTLRFMAVDTNNVAANQQHQQLMLVDLYFFERRMSARRVAQVIDCEAHARADFNQDLSLPWQGQTSSDDWISLDATDPLLLTACSGQSGADSSHLMSGH